MAFLIISDSRDDTALCRDLMLRRCKYDPENRRRLSSISQHVCRLELGRRSPAGQSYVEVIINGGTVYTSLTDRLAEK